MRLTLAVERMRPSIFQIELQRNHGNSRVTNPVGTAFAIHDAGYLITALHVIEFVEAELTREEGSVMAAYAGPDVTTPEIMIRGAFVGCEFLVVDRDELNDLALLKLPTGLNDIVTGQFGPKNAETRPKSCQLETEVPLDGEAIAVSGYPLNEPSLVTTSGYVASHWTLDNNRERILGDVTANPGSSGGPAYKLKDAKVIGVCVAGRLSNISDAEGNPVHLLKVASGLTLIVPALCVVSLLRRNGISIN
jgi:S1-C subfamily serine protease